LVAPVVEREAVGNRGAHLACAALGAAVIGVGCILSPPSATTLGAARATVAAKAHPAVANAGAARLSGGAPLGAGRARRCLGGAGLVVVGACRPKTKRLEQSMTDPV
jgi:hypothetical protein